MRGVPVFADRVVRDDAIVALGERQDRIEFESPNVELAGEHERHRVHELAGFVEARGALGLARVDAAAGDVRAWMLEQIAAGPEDLIVRVSDAH